MVDLKTILAKPAQSALPLGLRLKLDLRMNSISTCPLCRSDAPLKKSHILPKFAQRRMKERGRILRKDHSLKHPRLVQNFAIESMLCSVCEQHLTRWENYAARAFNQKRKFDVAGDQGEHLLTGLDYASLKLYLLSILWRMSVAKHEDFKLVELGPHEEFIRQMILRDDPGETTDYGCTLTVIFEGKERFLATRVADYNRYSPETLQYRVLLDGFLLIWQVGSKSARERSAEKFLFLQKDGSWRIKVSQANAVPFLREAIRTVLKSKHPNPI